MKLQLKIITLLRKRVNDLKEDEDRYVKFADIDTYYNNMFLRAYEKRKMLEEIIKEISEIKYEDMASNIQ